MNVSNIITSWRRSAKKKRNYTALTVYQSALTVGRDGWLSNISIFITQAYGLAVILAASWPHQHAYRPHVTRAAQCVVLAYLLACISARARVATSAAAADASADAF